MGVARQEGRQALDIDGRVWYASAMNESSDCLFDRHEQCNGEVEVGGFSLGGCDCICHEGNLAAVLPLPADGAPSEERELVAA